MSRSVAAGDGVDLVVDLDSPVPPFEQIRAAVAALVATGRLATGQRLPPVRQLAADLGIAPGTVQHAYTELRSAGVVSTATRRGVVVTGPAAPGAAELDLAASGFVESARRAGATDEAIRLSIETYLTG